VGRLTDKQRGSLRHQSDCTGRGVYGGGQATRPGFRRVPAPLSPRTSSFMHTATALAGCVRVLMANTNSPASERLGWRGASSVEVRLGTQIRSCSASVNRSEFYPGHKCSARGLVARRRRQVHDQGGCELRVGPVTPEKQARELPQQYLGERRGRGLRHSVRRRVTY